MIKALRSVFLLGALCAVVVALPALAEERAPGTVFKDCPECPEMIVIPPGTFIMGDNDGHKYEIPEHQVTIPKAFAIGKYEVTFNEWDACHAAGGCSKKPDDHTWGRDGMPVININHADAVEYGKWLSKHTGHTYRLASEAEWEYAARGGTATEYSWGDKKGVNLGNCRDCGSKWSAKGSAPVGSFKANPFGLHDVHGNVWEWTQDCWNTNYIGAPTDGSARNTGDCRNRAVRSGSWYYFHKNSRSAWRFKNDARVNSYNIGMRILRELP